MSEGKSGGPWTALAAIGGALSGVAAILALFIAKPDTITVLIPQQALQRAGLSQAANSPDGQAPATATTTTLSPTPVSETGATTTAPQTPPPTRTLAPGLDVSLISVSDTPDRYVVTLRFVNTSDQDIGVAVRRSSAFEGDLLLTDGRGGSCQMISNGEGWGSLESADVQPLFQGGDNSEFRVVGAGGTAQHTVFFNKMRCATRIGADASSLSVSGALVLLRGSERRAASLSFDGLQFVR